MVVSRRFEDTLTDHIKRAAVRTAIQLAELEPV